MCCRTVRPRNQRRHLRPARIPEGHRRLQRQAGGHDQWPLGTQSGLSATVQDLGRPGCFHLGIPIGGAMDRLPARGNLIVGSDEGCRPQAVFIGPHLEFTRDALIAVTGADMPIKLDSEKSRLVIAESQAGRCGFRFPADRRASISRLPAASTCQSRSAAARPIRSARWAASRSRHAKSDELPVSIAASQRKGAAFPPARRPGMPAELRVLPELSAPRHRTIASELLRRPVEGGARGGPHGLSFPRRPAVAVRRARPALRGRIRPVEHRRRCYPTARSDAGRREPIILHRDAPSRRQLLHGWPVVCRHDLIDSAAEHADNSRST